jgi:hypothetical protein
MPQKYKRNFAINPKKKTESIAVVNHGMLERMSELRDECIPSHKWSSCRNNSGTSNRGRYL